jgi:hypothetical protein
VQLNEVPFSKSRISKSLKGRRLGPASRLPALQREAMNVRRVLTDCPGLTSRTKVIM